MPIDNLKLKEICNRIPYKTLMEFVDNTSVIIAPVSELIEKYPLEELVEYGKLILYPISYIKERQQQELQEILNCSYSKTGYFKDAERVWLDDITKVVDLLYEWHIDFNDLIQNNKALNALENDAYINYIE